MILAPLHVDGRSLEDVRDHVQQLAARIPVWRLTATKTAAYTAKIGEMVIVDAADADREITLPKALSFSRGMMVGWKRVDSSVQAVTAICQGTDLIDRQFATRSYSNSFHGDTYVSDGAGSWLRWAQVGVSSLDFDPGEPGDWVDPDPSTVQEALDALAARVENIMVLKRIVDDNSAAGFDTLTDYHLTDATTWAVSKARILAFILETGSSDWDFFLLQNDNGFATNDATVKRRQVVANGSGSMDIHLDMPFEDEDATSELHFYFRDNAGANKLDKITVLGVSIS